MSLVVRKAVLDPSTVFWSKIEKLYGKVPKLVRLLLEFNGFDTYLALKGIQWDDKKYFFEALEESVQSFADMNDNDYYKIVFQEECKVNNQSLEKFKLKLGHKNLIINLCNELQKTTVEDFNNAAYSTVSLADVSREHTEVVVRQRPGKSKDIEHRYSRDENVEEHLEVAEAKRIKLDTSEKETHETSTEDEQIQYVYETEDDTQFFVEQEYLDENEETEIVEYQEISTEHIDHGEGMYPGEQIIKAERNFDQCFELTEYDPATRNISPSTDSKNSKKPKHMYSYEFLQTQMRNGENGKYSVTPGRRRPKLRKFYPQTEDGLLEKWKDLVRQSCEVIVPSELLARFDLSIIDITKIAQNIWEVLCPLCSKKLRLQLTHEGKYVNFKRSNFERHLRIVHYKQIIIFKGDDDQQEMLEEHTE